MAHRPSLPQGNLAVPSALECFTTRFGMGRGGTTPLRARHIGIIRYLSADCQLKEGRIMPENLFAAIRPYEVGSKK